VGGRVGTGAAAAPSEHSRAMRLAAARVHAYPEKINLDVFVFAI
jgi:hypothetical protein